MTAAQPSSPLFGKVYGGVFFWGGDEILPYFSFYGNSLSFCNEISECKHSEQMGFLCHRSGKKNGGKFLGVYANFFGGGDEMETTYSLFLSFLR